MAFCGKCGMKIEGEALFCPKCGASLRDVDSVQNVTTAKSSNETSKYRDEFDYSAYYKKEKRKKLVIVSIVVTIILCGGIALAFKIYSKIITEKQFAIEDNQKSNDYVHGKRSNNSSDNNKRENSIQKSSEYLSWKTYCGEYMETSYYDYEGGYTGSWLEFELDSNASDDNCGCVDIVFRGMHCYYELAYIGEGNFELTYVASKSDYSGSEKYMEITFISSPYNDDYYDALIFYDANRNIINTFISDENYWVEYSLGPIESMIVLASTRELTTEDLQGYSSFELSAIRNGIYAQYGYVFNNTGWNEYFSQYSWYEPDLSFTTSMVSYIEEINAGFIRKYEEEHFGGVYTP